MSERFANAAELIRSLNPDLPVYCVYEDVYRRSTRHFLDGFPGRVLYAVKANNHPLVLRQLVDAGVEHFDCASLKLQTQPRTRSTVIYR